jgi:transposase-like protein
VVSVANVIAVGVAIGGERTVLGAAAGPSEDHQFWVALLQSLQSGGGCGACAW